MDSTTFNSVMYCKTSFQILERIRELRNPQTVNVIGAAMTAFYSEKRLSLDNATKFMSWLGVYMGQINDIKDPEDKITNCNIIFKVLSCLPEKYNNFVLSWHLVSGNKGKPILLEFREALLVTERRMTTVESLPEEGGAAFAANSSRQKYCSYCKKNGHLRHE